MTDKQSTRSLKELTVRSLFFLLGCFTVAVGVSMFVLTNTGSDPFSVFMQGIAKTFSISNGIAHICINVVMLTGILIFVRHYIKVGTFVAFFIGPSIDLASFLLKGIINDSIPLVFRLIIMIIACVIGGLGLALIISADIGVGANDLMSVILSDKSKIQFRWARIMVDTTLVIVGFFLGGVVGIGTVVNIFVIGPIAQLFMPKINKTIGKCVNKLKL